MNSEQVDDDTVQGIVSASACFSLEGNVSEESLFRLACDDDLEQIS